MTGSKKQLGRKTLLFFSINFIFLSIMTGQKSLMSPANLYVKNGIHNLYSYHFDKAIISLDSAFTADPHHPVQPFVRLAVNWLQAQTECGYDSSYAVIEQEVKKLLPWYREHILQYPDNAEYSLYLGSVYGMKARISLAKKNGSM